MSIKLNLAGFTEEILRALYESGLGNSPHFAEELLRDYERCFGPPEETLMGEDGE